MHVFGALRRQKNTFPLYTRVRALRAKTSIFLNYSGHFWDLFGFGGSLLLKTYWWEGWHWPAARKLRISGIQKVETLKSWILDSSWMILNNFCRNSSFTGSVGLIIDSSRSGTCFSSCLASSKYFTIRKKCLFAMVFCFFCVYTPVPFPQICFWTLQYRNNVSSRMASRYTRIFDAGWLADFCFHELPAHGGS